MSTIEAKELLAGLQVERRLKGAGVFGDVYWVRDSRLASSSAGADEPKRIARVLNLADLSPQQQEKLLLRLRKLLVLAIPYVSLPSEVTRLGEDQWLILGPLHGRSLRECVKPNAPAVAEPSQLREFVTCSLTGLAALHAADLVHGDIRPANLFLDHADGKNSHAMWLGDAAIGTLAWLSGGRLSDPEASKFFPPDWQNGRREPSKSADIYALGLSLLEIHKGSDERAARQDAQGMSRPRWRANTAAFLADGLETLIQRMTALNETERFTDGREALAWWQGHASRQHRRQAAAIGAIVVALTISSWWNSSKAEAQISTLRSERDGALARLEQLQNKLDFPIARAVAEPEPPTQHLPVSLDDRAALLWERIGRKKIEAKLADPSDVEHGEARRAARWINKLRDIEFRPDFQAWQAYEFRGADQLRESWQRLGRKPWDEERTKDVEGHLSNLNKATEIWKTWAGKREVTCDSIQLFASNISDHEVQPILQEWLTNLNALHLMKVRLIRGMSKNRGKNRYVILNGESQGNYAWSENTSHDYAPDTFVGPVAWQAGDKVTITISADRSIYRAYTYPNIIDQKFDGPLALWKAHDAGIAYPEGVAEGATTSLEFEVVDCPGPPPSRLFERPLPKPIDDLLRGMVSPQPPDSKGTPDSATSETQ